MANLCSTAITFYSKNQEEINRLKDDFLKIIPDIKSDTPMRLFAEHYFPKEVEKLDLRYSVYSIFDNVPFVKKMGDYFYFEIDNETANSPRIGFWREILKQFYPEVELAYIAEESGNDLFEKYDKTNLFYPQNYYVEVYLDGDALKNTDCKTVEEVITFLNENLPFSLDKDFLSIEDLYEYVSDRLEEIDDEDSFSLGEFVEVHPDEYSFLRS